MTKAEIRKTALNIRNAIAYDKKSVYDDKIAENFFELLEDKGLSRPINSCVFSYASYGSEADSFSVSRELLKRGALMAYPLSHSDFTMEFKLINDFSDLKSGYKGILEPSKDCKEADFHPYFVIMPGVAFDKKGNRIGYGKGFYDRFLNKYDNKPLLIALCYECQLYEELPCEENDIQMDYIVTENGIYKC